MTNEPLDSNAPDPLRSGEGQFPGNPGACPDGSPAIPDQDVVTRIADAELAIAAAGWVPIGYLEPVTADAKGWVTQYGPIPLYAPPGTPENRSIAPKEW